VPQTTATTPARCSEECHALAVALERRIGVLWWELLRAADGGLSRTGAAVVAALAADGPLRITELAQREGVAQPSMTALVGRLEAAGAVVKRRDPDDGRATLVEVTAKGQALLDERAELRAQRLGSRLQERTTPEEREAIERALGALDRLIEDTSWLER
jgi:DNA-binding MarR family transcriptional regulator